MVAVVALFYSVGYWNNFFNALLYLNDSAMWPLQLVLRLYVVQGAPLPSAGDVAGERAAVAVDPDGRRGCGHDSDPLRLPVPAAVLHPRRAQRSDQGLAR